MSISAVVLRQLHHLYSQLAELRDQLERGPRHIKSAQSAVTRLEVELEGMRAKTIAARIAADQKQLQLKSGEDKILELRAKLNACNTNREYQALVEQIAADGMANSVLEDEILEALEKIEQLQINIGKAEQNVAKGKAELEKVTGQVNNSSAGITADIKRIEQELKEAEPQIPIDYRADYDRIMKVRGSDGMAAVESDCCGGCYQQITPNMINMLHLSKLVYCSCGRLLYLAED
ncbi:MAG: phospholipase [Pirellulales bacterium]|nr:phospholipase [Pirellulales bacterium]